MYTYGLDLWAVLIIHEESRYFYIKVLKHGDGVSQIVWHHLRCAELISFPATHSLNCSYWHFMFSVYSWRYLHWCPYLLPSHSLTEVKCTELHWIVVIALFSFQIFTIFPLVIFEDVFFRLFGSLLHLLLCCPYLPRSFTHQIDHQWQISFHQRNKYFQPNDKYFGATIIFSPRDKDLSSHDIESCQFCIYC